MSAVGGEYIGATKAAALLGISGARLRYLLQRHAIGVKMVGVWHLSQEDMNRLRARNRRSGRPRKQQE